MQCTFKILFFCTASCTQLFSGDPEPMSPDAIIAQAKELGYVLLTDLTDEQLNAIIKESEERLQEAKEQGDKKTKIMD